MPENIELTVLTEFSLGQRLGQLRAIPVDLHNNQPRSLLLIYAADFDIDPSPEMFFFPSDTLKMAMVTGGGQVRWKRDLGRAVIPGIWFCPVFTLDLDTDGFDEIFLVNQTNAQHPLSPSGFRLERLDARTGETLNQLPWPGVGEVPFYAAYRHFLTGGYVNGQPVLIAAQGTYGKMQFQAYGPGMELRWEKTIEQAERGARGSHMCPVVDINGDGIDELLWGERCLSLADGEQLFCADADTYRGHSDIIQPVLNRSDGSWRIFTTRESRQDVAPRVCCYDATGRRLWGDLQQGHVDMGWVAHTPERRVAMAIRIGEKTCGPDGRFHRQREEFVYDFDTGERIDWPFSTYRTIPVDLDGDGYHEFIRGVPGGDGEVLDATGNSYGRLGGTAALASQFADAHGEQVLLYDEDGTVRIVGDANAFDGCGRNMVAR